jgi:hypothetical protein
MCIAKGALLLFQYRSCWALVVYNVGCAAAMPVGQQQFFGQLHLLVTCAVPSAGWIVVDAASMQDWLCAQLQDCWWGSQQKQVVCKIVLGQDCSLCCHWHC